MRKEPYAYATSSILGTVQPGDTILATREKVGGWIQLADLDGQGPCWIFQDENDLFEFVAACDADSCSDNEGSESDEQTEDESVEQSEDESDAEVAKGAVVLAKYRHGHKFMEHMPNGALLSCGCSSDECGSSKCSGSECTVNAAGMQQQWMQQQ